MMTQDLTHSRTLRNIGWGATLLFAAASLTACGSSPQSMLGTAPSALGAIASADSSAGGTLSAFKDGHGNSDNGNGHDGGKPTAPAPTTPPPTSPTTGTAPGSDGHGHDAGDPPGNSGGDHGNTQLQVEGIATSVTGTCPALTIVIGDQTITTDATTDFQRGDCTDIVAGQQLHIAATTVTVRRHRRQGRPLARRPGRRPGRR